MIILTEAQATLVRGETSPGHMLEPIALADGVTFVLSERVLSDPAHTMRHKFLGSLPTRNIAAKEWVSE